MDSPTYTYTTSRLNKGNFAPSGMQFLIVKVSQGKKSVSSAQAIKIELLTEKTIPMLAQATYAKICETIGI